ncbi:MAG: hypothetical protein A2W19_08495 [Spirochaetes bacterium RBG_16_49_21]|nr:MAG: hypothetical protein A2W19_08495 [Spirochaetes bacterium RBG_16_49_21]
MEELLNDSIIEMVNDGILSMRGINNLIFIKSFIDRVASKKFIDKEAVMNLEKKYGVRPNIITWGDYFQTQMATTLHVLSDDEFDRAVDTLKFDIIASYTIFSEKDRSFFEWVELTYMTIMNHKEADFTPDEEEIIHLRILMDYYENVGIVNNFTESEMYWFAGFQEAQAQ